MRIFSRGLAAFFASFLLFASMPASAEWLRAESPNFVVYSESGEARVRQQILQLEEFDRLLRVLTGTRDAPSPNKLNIYFVRGNRQLRIIGEVGTSVGGFYVANPHAVMAAVDESENRGANNNHVLFHEYAHHFMMQYHPGAYPPWYVEGFAEYVGTAQIAAEGIEVGRYNPNRAAWAADASGWIPFERILFDNFQAVGGEAGARYYAQSWFLVHYLLRDEGRRQATTAYLTAIARGEDRRAAFTAAFGHDTRALERSLRAYMNNMTYTRIRRQMAEPPPVTVTRLPGSAEDLLLLQAALNLGVSATRQDQVLAQVRRLAARHQDEFARRVLALAEIRYGDPAAGEGLLEPLLAAAPGDVGLLFLRGMRHLNAGRKHPEQQRDQFRQARAWFGRAHRADPNHFPTLFHYAESHSIEPGFVSQNSENVLLLANQLAPQVGVIRLAAARMLMMRSKFEEAIALLLPLASSAHENGQALTARAMLEAARQRRQPAEATAEEASAE